MPVTLVNVGRPVQNRRCTLQNSSHNRAESARFARSNRPFSVVSPRNRAGPYSALYIVSECVTTETEGVYIRPNRRQAQHAAAKRGTGAGRQVSLMPPDARGSTASRCGMNNLMLPAGCGCSLCRQCVKAGKYQEKTGKNNDFMGENAHFLGQRSQKAQFWF